VFEPPLFTRLRPASRVLVAGADTAIEVALAIERHHAAVRDPRPRRALPH
jgi:hypothetical protein